MTWQPSDPLDAPCEHAVPQAASCLNGVCVFCWRDRAGLLKRTSEVRVQDLLEANNRYLEEGRAARRELAGAKLVNDALTLQNMKMKEYVNELE